MIRTQGFATHDATATFTPFSFERRELGPEDFSSTFSTERIGDVRYRFVIDMRDRDGGTAASRPAA